MSRACVIVLDAVGAGELPDAAAFGDEGSDTLGNVARAVAPLDDARMADFVNLLDEVNRLAELSPGFVWRLQGPSGNATDLEFARRFEWFQRWDGPSVALWWQPAGTLPTVDDAFRRLGVLAEQGPTPEAFTFKQRFPAPA